MIKLRRLIGAALLGYALQGACAGPAVDLNNADAATLAEAMVGIGPAKAEAIVEYRKQNGPFASIDDLVLIKGIGTATIEKNRERLTVGKPAP
jgi:competence protein ComEA